jgi:GntR family transcriptional regulator
MRVNIAPAKWVQVLTALQQRIEDGSYPAGQPLPTEAALTEEFNVSRSTILKALGVLRQDGWIESQQGKHHMVRGVPVRAGAPGYVRSALETGETAEVRLLKVGAVLPTTRIATALEVETDTPVYQRRRLLATEDSPVSLSVVYVPVELAAGTALGRKDPLPNGVGEHLRSGPAGGGFEYATTVVSARRASDDEAELLAMGEGDPVLCLLVVGHATGGQALAAVDIVMPADRHDLEDVYPLTD